MAGTIIVDRIESDASYASTINVAGQITFSNTVNFGAYSGTAPVAGFYLPTTNNLAFTTASTERMRIDSAGNVGIGTSSPAYKLDVGTGSVVGNIHTRGSISSGTLTGFLIRDIPRLTNDTATFENTFIGCGATVGNIIFQQGSSLTSASNTERMRIDSSGLVGINTSSPSRRLHVASGSAMKLGTATGALFNDTGNDGGILVGSDFTFGSIQGCNAAGTSAKKLVINAEGGECYIAGTTDNGAYNLQCIGTGVWGAGAYVNGSDERIKNNIVPLDSGLDVVAKLNPVTYKYKEDWSKDQSTQTGFIAQELLTALEGKNYVDGVVQQGGSESYYSVAYQNIIPILTKAIQEQQALITALTARITALENN
jgi:hypothetical protein